MKILMTGPGKGHNIQRFLRYFNENSSSYQLYYYRYNKATHYNLAQYDQVKFIATFDALGLIRALRKTEIIWVHNWTPWPVLYLILKFKKSKAVLNFNFWSEKLPREILRTDNWKSSFYKRFFKKCDVLQSSWYSVKDLVDQFDHPNSRLMRWGFEEEYFQPVYVDQLSAFTLDFVKSLPEDKFKFFVPKSIGFPNRHDLMVRAAKMLVDRGRTDFVIYFWKGNRVENKYEQEILGLIHDLGLTDQVKLITHPFLTNQEIKYIWQQMDAGLQLCDQDQLTSAFTEPQLFGKQVIASSIPSYHIYNEFYEVNVPLVQNNDLESISRKMEGVMTYQFDEEEKKKRQGVIKTYYRFSKNIEDILSYLSSLYRN